MHEDIFAIRVIHDSHGNITVSAMSIKCDGICAYALLVVLVLLLFIILLLLLLNSSSILLSLLHVLYDLYIYQMVISRCICIHTCRPIHTHV